MYNIALMKMQLAEMKVVSKLSGVQIIFVERSIIGRDVVYMENIDLKDRYFFA